MLPRTPEPRHMTDAELEILAAVLPTIIAAGSLGAGMAVRILAEVNVELHNRPVEQAALGRAEGGE